MNLYKINSRILQSAFHIEIIKNHLLLVSMTNTFDTTGWLEQYAN